MNRVVIVIIILQITLLFIILSRSVINNPRFISNSISMIVDKLNKLLNINILKIMSKNNIVIMLKISKLYFFIKNHPPYNIKTNNVLQ